MYLIIRYLAYLLQYNHIQLYTFQVAQYFYLTFQLMLRRIFFVIMKK
jgi:hypothetical protein